MALPLEANSLSTITQLAGNPPKYPTSPVEEKRQPLVLYIARVPGKKDIILTTMKPRLKTLTAEDVMNSLYYLHLDLPSDALLLEETQTVEDIGNVCGLPKDHEAPRPSWRDSNIKKLPELPPEFDRQLCMGQRILKAPHRSDEETEMLKSASVDSRPPPPSRPAPTVEVSPTRRLHEPRPLIPQSQINKQPFQSDEQSRIQYLECGSIPDHSPAHNPFSITFIRRDPTSAAQWNIGKIKANPQSARPSLNVQPKTSFERWRSSILIHLTTEGYGQFRTCPVISRTDEDGENQQRLQPSLDTQFEREVRLAALGFWSRKSREHRKSLSDQSTSSKSVRASDSLESSGREYEEASQRNRGSLFEAPECGFLSPWNGRCEFSTGNSGRTLKCKHALPNSASAINMSELRFNLPSMVNSGGTSKSLASLPAGEAKRFSNSKNDVKSTLFPESRKSCPRSQPPHHTSYAAMYPSSDDGDNDGDNDAGGHDSLNDRVDLLDLGREKAGGGIRGKRAKLGKLIVYDEGLKMLDLVVAANMGVWWTIWAKSS